MAIKNITIKAALAGLLSLLPALPAAAQNQTPTVSAVSTDWPALPYKLQTRRVTVPNTLPTLQSFVAGQFGGEWLLVGGRTNGLHNFTSDPLANFPPSQQNRRLWVINPQTWETWSRPLSNSDLTEDQVDELSTTAMESVQVGNTLYTVGGYGYSRSREDFMTFPTLTAIDVPTVIDWVKRVRYGSGNQDLSRILRRTSDPALRITGGQLTVLKNQAVLVFGQSFMGGYGDPNADQVYSGQVRKFRIIDTGGSVSISDSRYIPTQPNLDDYRRRDYNLANIIDNSSGSKVATAVALSGVFTTTNGIWTVPVEIDANGKPSMADPSARTTFKQAMNGYNTANFTLFDSANGDNHIVLLGGISYVSWSKSGGFVEDSNIPFINNATVVLRKASGIYRQILMTPASFPLVEDKGGNELYFGAESGFFLNPAIKTLSNNIVDLRAALEQAGSGKLSLGYVFGGIAADKPNFGNSTASNEVFEVLLSRGN